MIDYFKKSCVYHCIGEYGDPACMLCNSSDCKEYPVLCRKLDVCSCSKNHFKHTHVMFEEVMKTLALPYNVDKEFAECNRIMSETLKSMVDMLDRCRWRFEEVMNAYLDSKYKYGALKRKLLNDEQPTMAEMTGANINGMMR